MSSKALKQYASHVDNVREVSQPNFQKLAIALVLAAGAIVAAHLFANTGGFTIVLAAVIGLYVAMNIGANDVANNVGPAVGSGVIKMSTAIVIAAIFEASGALIAGGDVVDTVRKGIIDPALIPDKDTFIWIMLAALGAGGIWLNIATKFGAPVSTTHSIVGGVMGAGLAAAWVTIGGDDWYHIVNWQKMGAIAISWVSSPVLGAGIAMFFMWVIKRTITYQPDVVQSAKRVVPILVAIMAWAFTVYLIVKGLKQLVDIEIGMAALIGLGVAVVAYMIMRGVVKRAREQKDEKLFVNSLFVLPLVVAICFLSFSHGSNDVANSIGPLAAINGVLESGSMTGKADIPLWVMVVGAVGIAAGLAMYGPKLIKKVGSDITELTPPRAFCVAMAAAIVVILASHYKMPVSTTHISIGAIFGIGFFRWYRKAFFRSLCEDIQHHHPGSENEIEQYLIEFENSSLADKKQMMVDLRSKSNKLPLTRKERRQLSRVVKSQEIKRDEVYKIIAAWIITVPGAGILSAMLFFMIRGIML